MTMFIKQVCGKRQEEKERLKTKKKKREKIRGKKNPSSVCCRQQTKQEGQ